MTEGPRLPAGQEEAEVRIAGNYDAVLLCGPVEDGRIGGGMESVVPHVRGVVAAVTKSLRDQRRDRIVDEKPHALFSGRARSLTASAA